MLINKLSNLKLYRVIYTFLILIAVIAYTLSTFKFNVYPIITASFLFLVFCILYLSKSNSYRFDTTGDVIIVEVIGVYFLGLIKKRQSFIEIPKRKIYYYSVKKGILKTKFKLTIASKRSGCGKKTISFSISFLSKKNRLNIEQELEKVIIQNNEQ